jgi:C4-dicarboxylate transporter, DctM subunit
MTTAFIVLPFILLFFGIPIYLILLLTALVAVVLTPGVSPTVVQTAIFGSLDSFPLLAIPFFILAGEIMGQGGIAKRLVAWIISMIGGVRGSLALTTIASSEVFGAISGSSVGCVAAVGRLMYPSLRQAGYSERFSVSLIASSGAIAVIIPPSIPMIIYGATAQQPVTELFLAGFIPGMLIGLFDAAYVLFRARKDFAAVGARFEWSNVWTSTKEASWALGSLAVIFGGIYGGVFTPTEAAGVAVVYATLVSRYVYGDLTWAGLWRITVGAAKLTAQIMVIVAAAGLYSWFLTTGGLPQLIVGTLQSWNLGATHTLFLFNLLLLVVGSFLEPPAAILILTPLFLPVVTALGVDPIHFGIIVTVNLSIGLFTPPFGLNIFAAHSLFKAPLGTLYRGVLPFVAANFLALMLITYVPSLSLILLKGHH